LPFFPIALFNDTGHGQSQVFPDHRAGGMIHSTSTVSGRKGDQILFGFQPMNEAVISSVVLYSALHYPTRVLAGCPVCSEM